ncbi:MAG: hypothetical protein ACJ788_21970, partial [Ktedonobacteraceae bacterium]
MWLVQSPLRRPSKKAKRAKKDLSAVHFREVSVTARKTRGSSVARRRQLPDAPAVQAHPRC